MNQPIHATYYFRAKFTYNGDLAFVTSLTGAVLRDDLAAVYLNGQEVFRDPQLPQNPAANFYCTTQTPSETAYTTFNILASRLQAGENNIAVEVHQASNTSSDVSFDFQLAVNTVPGARVTVNILSDDSDADAMSDTWERANGLDYQNGGDGTLDPDLDGINNRLEFLALTDPFNSSQFLRPGEITRTGNTLNLTFHGLSTARRYQLESGPAVAGPWTNLGAPFTPPASSHTVNTPFPVGVPQTFYRLRVDFSYP